MSKKSKPGRSSKKNLPQNAAWLEDRLERHMLDLEALSAMSIDDVNAELKTLRADKKALVESINEHLPAGAALPLPEAPAKKKRTSTRKSRAADRQPASPPASRSRKSQRMFGFKSALILSGLIIAASLFIPRFVRELREDRLRPATAIEDSTPVDLNRPPTWIEGPAADELVRGVRYTIEGLEQVVLQAPLPTNPGNLTASLSMQLTVDGNGKVIKLAPISTVGDDFKPVIDSVLHWQFSALPDSSQRNDALVTVEYFPE